MTKLVSIFDASSVPPQACEVTSRFANIPKEMREGKWWMVSHAGTKKPCRVSDGKVLPGSWNNPDHHCSFDEALEAIRIEPSLNLALILGFGNDFVCFDVDPLHKVADEHREEAINIRAKIKLALSEITYCETSMSGNGLHYLGRASQLTEEERATHKARHSKYNIDLLLRHTLILTGDCLGTNSLADISEETRQTLSAFRSSSVPAPVSSIDAITPAHCTESRLQAIIGGSIHGPAFRTGRYLRNGWSDVMTAVTNTAAQFCTDENTVYRVLWRSGLVQLAEPSASGECRAEKFARLWTSEWQKALAKTEQSRRNLVVADAKPKKASLAELWDQTLFVKRMVENRAAMLVSQALMNKSEASTFAPYFLYMRPERANDLQDDLKDTDDDFGAKLMDARMQASRLDKTNVSNLDDFINEMVAKEAKINRQARIKWYNDNYYIVENHGGTPMVFENAFDPFSGSQASWRIAQFCQAKSYDEMLCGWDATKGMPKLRPAAFEWCNSEKARRYVKQEMRYDTLDRTIETDTGRILNTFSGWMTTPVKGEWPAIHHLIHEVICARNDQAADYLMNYLAHMVQKPMQLPGTAIILQSEEQGTGKSTFMDILRELLGERYCATTADASTMVGQFNNSAKEKVLLHFEEAVAPNDRAVESKVKALITNKTMTYNAKGIAAVEARNCARVFMTSNASQVAHIARHDRRMFVLTVSPRFANDWDYWGAFRKQYPHEMEAFMHALQTRDISCFKPSVIPHTQGRDDQKLESAFGVEQVLRDLLENGVLPPCSRYVGDAWEVRTKALAEHFRNFNVRIGSSAPQPARVLKPIVLIPGRNRTMTVNGDPAQTHRVITIPTLPNARAAFLRHMNVTAYDWGDEDEAEWSLE